MGSGHAITLLHLSDLHFGRHHRFEGVEAYDNLLDRLRQDLDERRDRDGLRPDLIVLSGDFTEYGRKEEFDRAYRFVEGLARLVELSPRRMVMVPGNHDINWNKSRAYFEDCAGDGVEPVEPYARKLVFYKQFFDRFYEGESGIAFTEDEPWSLFDYPELGVAVAGLNSVIAESHRDEHHYGFLGERQIRAFAEELRPYKERSYLRIGVLHHDPFQRRGSRAEQDYKDLARLLRPSLNLLLHGDVHEERLQWLYGNVPVFGVGSAAVSVAQRAPEVPNEYQILRIHSAGVRRELRAFVPDQRRWVGTPRGDAAGEPWIQEIPVSFDRVEALAEPGGPASEADLARIVESYRRAVARNQSMPTVFDLLGVNEAGESAGGLDFLRVFVPQDARRAGPARPRHEELRDLGLGDVAQVPPGPSMDVGGDAAFAGPWESSELAGGFFERATRPIDELLSSAPSPWLFLLGAPGAGKTALTRWLLLKLCVPGEGVRGLPDDLIPVRIEMRRFDEEHRRSEGEHTFFDHLDREHGERFLSLRGEHLRALAREGRLYWIFDGLDEVIDEDRRRRYAEMIGGLVDKHRGSRGLVTSRVAGAEIARPVLERAGFVAFTLQDFTDGQRDRFLDAWHALIFARDPETGRHRRARIARALSDTPSLGELCNNPLLCALLAYLNREEDLPRRRHWLYQKVLERMAEHWDANKGLPPRPMTERFDLESKLLFLRRLAWQMLDASERGAGNAIEQAELEDFAAAFCEQRWAQSPDAARRTAEALLRHLRERNAVLAFFGGTTYGFAHRTFLEHLAAVEAHERFRERQWEIEDLGKLFAARWQDAAWEEALLLLCGSLQEANPDHVVRVLQSIPGKDRAIVYGSLEKYLAFCIKALGEVTRLDRGVVGDFACAINDILELHIREDVLSASSLQGAFRRCAGRWPDVERLMSLTTKEAMREGREWLRELHVCWVAAAGKERRLSVLSEALKDPHALPYLLCTEAAALGSWTATEIDALCKIADECNELDKLNIVASIATDKGITWSVDQPPIRSLLDLMRSSESIDIRCRSAWILLRAACHMDEALSVLKGFLQIKEDHVVQQAALCLADVGRGHEVIDVLGRHAHQNPSCMVRLAELSRTSGTARETLRTAVARLRAQSGAQPFVDITLAAERAGFSLVVPEETIERIRAVEEVKIGMSLLSHITYVPALCPLAVNEYLSMFRSVTPRQQVILQQYRSRFTWSVCSIDPQHGGPALIELWKELMASSLPDVAILAAERVMRVARDLVFRRDARQLLLGFLDDVHPDGTRLMAARNLGIEDTAAYDAHRALARTAQSERDRFTAARFIGDLSTLNILADSAEHPYWRERARHELEVYGQIAFLLHVGQPRRARVRLHGREAGILEETSTGGGTRFTYLPDYLTSPKARPLAPNLPLRPEPYVDEATLHSFFANLLPEGPIYDQTARRLGLRRTDRFGMLLRVGADVMGAVEVLPEEDG